MQKMENAHALVIGIAAYQNINKLPPIVGKDALDIHGLLVDPQYCGYPPENVRLLLDDQATRSAILQALDDMAARSDDRASIFIYLSSHGRRIETGSQSGEYLLPVDAAYSSGELIASTAISGEKFTTTLHSIPARKVVVIFDCCHAGGIGRPKDATAPVLHPLPESYYDKLIKGRGRVILASSRSTESSYILDGDQNSIFTKHLLAGLRGGIPSEDGLIRIFDLYEYLQPRVTSDHHQQHPIFKGELEENFPISLYRGGSKGVISKDPQGFRFDAYISYVDQEPDASWIWETLVPRLEAADLQIAVSGDAEAPGVARVVNVERGITQSKRTILALSQAYLADHMADFENVLAQTRGIQEGTYRLLPVKIEAFDTNQLQTRLSMLATLNLAHPQRAEREFDRLIRALKEPLPRR